MRAFWGVIAVLLGITIGYFLFSGGSARESARVVASNNTQSAPMSRPPARPRAERPRVEQPVVPPQTADPVIREEPAPMSEIEITPEASGIDEGIDEPVAPEQIAQVESAPKASVETTQVADAGKPSVPGGEIEDLDELLEIAQSEDDDPTGEEVYDLAPRDIPVLSGDDGEVADLSGSTETKSPQEMWSELAGASEAAKQNTDAPDSDVAGEPAEPVVVEGDTTVLNGVYRVTGKGTKQQPYVLDWELLMSSYETYRPRLGKKKIPEWIEFLNNKHVRIVGYVAFPLMAETQDEMLVMLNQWDGCCIGVPPTPYDAIEVRLKEAATGSARFATYGKVEGVLKIDPYLVGDWLVGLYLMEDGSLNAQTFGDSPQTQHQGP